MRGGLNDRRIKDKVDTGKCNLEVNRNGEGGLSGIGTDVGVTDEMEGLMYR